VQGLAAIEPIPHAERTAGNQRVHKRKLAVTSAVILATCALVVSIVATSSSASVTARPTDRFSVRHVDQSQTAADASTFADGPGAVTLMGTGQSGDSGLGGPATSAELEGPTGVAVDPSGDVFVADTGDCAIVEIPANAGTQHSIVMAAHHAYVIAGGKCAGSSSSLANIGFATSLEVDSTDDVFVANPSGDEISEIPAASDQPKVVAGNGHPGYEGDGQAATNAELNDPEGIALDAFGDLFIADTSNCAIREVPTHGGSEWGIQMSAGDIYTVAGTRTCGQTGDGGPAVQSELWDPTDVAVGPGENLVIADAGGEEVADVPSASGTYYATRITARHLAIVAGFGFYGAYLVDGQSATGQIAELNSPGYIALDAEGDVYIADTYSSSIRIVPDVPVSEGGTNMAPGNMYTLAGALPTGTGDEFTKWVDPEVLYPQGLAVGRGGAIYYADSGANVVRELTARVRSS
jgi:NHL repeat